MFTRSKKTKLPLNIEVYNVRWYPSNRGIMNSGSRRIKPEQMPPLMVRKAEWRR